MSFLVSLLFSTQIFASYSVQFVEKKNELVISKGKQVQKVKVKIPKGFESEIMEQGPAQIFQSKSMLFVLLALSDGESGTTMAYGISNAGKLLWSKDLNGFNAAPPLIENGFIYLGVIDRVFKLRQSTGKAVWQHKGLFKNPSIKYNGVDPIKREGNKINFALNLNVDDKTGKIDKVFK